jgi:hypothetical protein
VNYHHHNNNMPNNMPKQHDGYGVFVHRLLRDV